MNRAASPLLRITVGLLAAAVAFASMAHADDDARDQELARKALIEGRILSLSAITEKVKPNLPGTILGVELEVEDGDRLVYEFSVIDSAGRLKEVDVDAATAEILSIEDDD
jgi:uncharacterized membrane protein YkoI